MWKPLGKLVKRAKHVPRNGDEYKNVLIFGHITLVTFIAKCVFAFMSAILFIFYAPSLPHPVSR